MNYEHQDGPDHFPIRNGEIDIPYFLEREEETLKEWQWKISLLRSASSHSGNDSFDSDN